MALPTYQAIGTAAAGTGAVSPAWPTHQAGDFGILYVESRCTEAVSLSDAQGFTEAPNSPQASAAVSGTQPRLTVFVCEATSSSMAAPTVADPGDHVFAVIITARHANGCQIETSAGDILNPGSSTVTIPGGTTTVADCLIFATAAHGADLGPGTDFYGSWSNADLANVTQRFEDNTNAGDGGGLGIVTGEKATAGAFGATTTTALVSHVQARHMLALKPKAAATVRQLSALGVG